MEVYHGIILTDTVNLERIRPLGAYSIANVLRKHGYNILVIDFFSRIPLSFLESLLKKFITKETLFLGYSSSLFKHDNIEFFPVNSETIETLNLIAKNQNSNISIILGGAQSQKLVKFNKIYNRNLNFTHVMHGLSESMILDYVSNLEKKITPKFSSVFNGIYEIDYNTTASGFDFKYYRHTWADNDFIGENEALPIEIGRGCIFKCKFCSYPLIGKDPRDTSYLKNEEILLSEILENYDRFKTLTYVVIDDTFNERIEKIEMLAKIRDKSKLDLNFTGFNRIDLIARKKEQLSLLKDANFNGHFFGIESMNYETAKCIGKGIRPDEITETLYKIKDNFNGKVNITAGFIVGLPFETKETFYKWFNEATKESYPIDNFSLSPLGIYSSFPSESEFYKNPNKYGYHLHPGGGMWISNEWTSSECRKIVDDQMKYLIDSGRQKIDSFRLASLTRLGYKFSDVIGVPTKKFREEELKSKAILFINNYIDKLLKL